MNRFFFLLSLIPLVTALPAENSLQSTSKRPREAYVSLLYGDGYVLPLRVMMHSLKLNSPDAGTTRDRIVMLAGETSETAKRQLDQDGIRTLPVPSLPSPYIHGDKFHVRFTLVMTKLLIFNMTQYDRIVFIDADALVLMDLSSVFSCGTFCATFINSFYFNSGFMLVTPNTTVFEDMQLRLPKTPSYDGGDQGFLNEYYPHLTNAPIFDPHAPHYTGFTRLPFSWHVDHSAYLPTFSFEFEKSPRCGKGRVIEWLGPPFLKPWAWHGYAILPLSWTWHSYRKQLVDPYPPGHDRLHGLLLLLVSYLFLMILRSSFRSGKSTFLVSFLPRLCPFRNAPSHMAQFYPILGGSLLWVGAVGFCLLAIPPMLTPYFAAIIFVHLRMVSTLLALVCVACVFCLGQHHSPFERDFPDGNEKSVEVAFHELMVWALIDALYFIVWCALLWRVPFPSVWSKLFAGIFVLLTQLILVAVMFTRISATWLRLAGSLMRY